MVMEMENIILGRLNSRNKCVIKKQLKKVENHGSVRDLLKKSIDACSKDIEIEHISEMELANTSLFSRRDYINSLSTYLKFKKFRSRKI